MAANLGRRAARATALLVIAQGVALFVSAGSVAYWNGWLFVGLQAITMGATNVYLYRRDPALLARRVASEETGERDPFQRRLMLALRVLSLAMLVAAGLLFRFGVRAPISVVIAGVVVFLAGVALVVRVFVESTYTSSVIEVADGQRVIATGPYRWVRHPMYTGVVLMGLGTPLVLGEPWAALAIAPMLVVLVLRIRAEERFLSANLAGYEAYTRATRARLVPGVF